MALRSYSSPIGCGMVEVRLLGRRQCNRCEQHLVFKNFIFISRIVVYIIVRDLYCVQYLLLIEEIKHVKLNSMI